GARVRLPRGPGGDGVGHPAPPRPHQLSPAGGGPGVGPQGVSEDARFVGSRRKMIEEIRAKGITDLELLQLFDRVPRHRFMPEGVWNRAYEDAPVPIGYGQTISQPSLQAFYLSVLRPTRDESVLEIGTG